jgi:putative SOS response-associated peptidase YedK
MCNYNGMKVSKVELIRLREIEKELREISMPFVNGYDFQQWPVVKPTAEGCDWEIVNMEWGFRPWFWHTAEDVVRNRQHGKAYLNARNDELFSKGPKESMWESSAIKRRCLVLSSGFYDWRHVEQIGKSGKPLKAKAKYPYHVSVKNKPVFFMAGIWNGWKDKSTEGGGEYIESFAIVTTEANEIMSEIHNSKLRMPTILPEDLASEWIKPGLSEQRIKEIASYQVPSREMNAHTIRKDFQNALDPMEAFEYEGLEPIKEYA